MPDLLTFSFSGDFDRNRLIDEAIEVILYADVQMGKIAIQSKQEEIKSNAIALLQRLKEERVSFPPRLDVRHLTQSDFDQLGTRPSRKLAAQLQENNFYYVNVPVTLFPRSGWAFTHLECGLEFCPEEPDPNLRPVAYDIFPDDVWTEILTIEQHLEVGLDGNFGFRAEIEEIKGAWQKLSGDAQAKLIAKIGAGGKFVIGPFTRKLRKPQVRARGRGNAEVFWQLNGSQYVDEEDILLNVVLAVPKRRNAPIDLVGALQAYHSFQFINAQLKDWINDFPEAVRSLFIGGIPIAATAEWKSIAVPG